MEKHKFNARSVCEYCVGHENSLPKDTDGKFLPCPKALDQASRRTPPLTSPPPTKKPRKEMLLMEKLINAVFVDRSRIITTEDGTEIWSLPEDGHLFWNGVSTKRLVIHPQWLTLSTQLLNGAHTIALLEGKAGRGKSVFLRYMIIRMLEDEAIPNDATFAYIVKDSGNTYCTFWIVKNGCSVNVVDRMREQPDYLFLDNVDSSLHLRGEKLNLGLTTGERGEVLKEFQKRVMESGERGKYYAMPAPDLNVMRLMFPDLPPDELQFRYDVLGGNPRRFLKHSPSSVSHEMKRFVYPELQNCIFMFFGAKYDHEANTVEGLRARWVMSMIADEVQQSTGCDSSLFRAHFATEDEEGRYQERFASSFLRLVAGALDSMNDASLRDALKRIVGSFGLGYAHKYLSHQAFLAGDPSTITFGLNPARAIVQLPTGLYGCAGTLVRSIPDLQTLRGLPTYGLPTVSTFPAIDAIVSTNLLQMTIGDQHGDAVTMLPDIAAALGVRLADLLLIFVVESVEKARAFQFPVLPGIRMVVTPRNVCTASALR